MCVAGSRLYLLKLVSVATVIISEDRQCWVPVAGYRREVFFAGRVLSVLLADFQKGLEKIVLERKKESMRSAC